MNLAGVFVRNFGYPLWLVYKHQSALLDYYRRFTPLWSADRSQLEAMRVENLRAILSHANSTSHFYRERFLTSGFEPKGLKQCEDITSLPFLTKDELNGQMDKILSSEFKKAELITSSTGGSSGVPLTFYRDHRVTSVRRSQDYLFNAKIGVYPGTKRAWVWGSPLDTVNLKSIKARVTNFLTERAIHFYSFDATPANIREFIEQLNRHRPEIIFAYPNMLAAIAFQVRDEQIKVAPIPKVVATAEPLYDWQRQLFKEVLGAETFERYGSREIGTAASEGYRHCGMHIFEPSYYVEVVDEQGNAVADGGQGELVVTDFYNHAMPLIRYRTGDMVIVDNKPCSCGSTWSRIMQVGGRILDLISRPDGSQISGLAIMMSLRTSGFREKVQVVQTTLSSMTVKYLVGGSIPEEVQRKFQATIDGIMGAPIEITYTPVESLSYEKSGKYRYVTSECIGKVGSVAR